MKMKLGSLVFAAAAFVGASIATPVYAHVITVTDTISIDNGQFVLDEFNGSYFVQNNSSTWYIYAFAVSNPNALTDGPTTGFTNWNAYSISLKLNGAVAVPVNAYVTGDANITDWNNVTLNTVDLLNYIAPETGSGLFYFTGLAASDVGLLVVNSDGVTSQFSSGGNTPLPATLPLFASGLGALGLLGWRKKRKAQATA